MTLPIRHATPNDATALAILGARLFSENFAYLYDPRDLAAFLAESYSPEYFLQELKHCTILLAMDGADIAAYAKLGALSLPAPAPKKGAAELHRLYIASGYQGQGLGHAMMQEILSQPCMKAASEIYLGVWENNFRAQKFYAGYGFLVVGEYLYPVGGHRDRELIMRLEKPANVDIV